jgi:hypothetical protein
MGSETIRALWRKHLAYRLQRSRGHFQNLEDMCRDVLLYALAANSP